MEQNHTLREQLLFFVLDGSAYALDCLEVHIRCNGFSVLEEFKIVDLGRRKKTVSNNLPADAQGKWGLHDTEKHVEVGSSYSIPFAGTLLWNPMRAHFPITQSLVNNCPHCSNTDIHLLRQHSQCGNKYDKLSIHTKLNIMNKNHFV